MAPDTMGERVDLWAERDADTRCRECRQQLTALTPATCGGYWNFALADWGVEIH